MSAASVLCEAVTETTAVAFPGQGGAWPATITALHGADGHPLVVALAERLGTDRWDELDGLDTGIAQPAVYVAGLVGVAGALYEPGRDPVGLALGHSLGEITAAAWAGAMTPLAGLDLVLARGALGRQAQDRRPGAMAAINRWDGVQVEWLRRGVIGRRNGVLDLAVVNSVTQRVLAGDADLVALAVSIANDEGAVARSLPIGGAYHSSLMAPFVDDFRRLVSVAITADPRVAVLSSTSQQSLATAADLVEALTRSLVLPVDWPATVAAAAELGVTHAIEAGPGDTLSRLSRFAPELRIVGP